MVDFSQPFDQDTVTNVPINPDSNNPIEVDQNSYVQTEDNGGVDDDGFAIAGDVTGSTLSDQINIAIVIDTSGSTRNSSGSDFDGNGTDETILEAELIAAREVFQSYIDAGYDPGEVNISLVTYASNAEVRGTYNLSEAADFDAMLQEIRDDGPNGGTDFDEGLESAGDAFAASGASPDDQNIVVFMSDGFPTESSNSDIIGERIQLEADWNATISGIGIGENSSLSRLQLLDNTSDGAEQVETGQELADLIVEPLVDADFLRFEIVIEGTDNAGNPLTETIVLQENDPRVTTTQLGWSFTGVSASDQFDAGTEVTVTVNSIFAEDPGDPGSGEQVVTTDHSFDVVICFTPGTRILTPRGEVPVEELAVGDRVVTRDHGIQPIRWIGRREINATQLAMAPKLRPVLIRADALGPGRPERDMRVSRQHRILIRDWRAEMMFGAEDGVLVPAHALCNDSSITEERPREGVTYLHIAFDRHEVVYADGIEAESLHPAEAMTTAVDPEQRAELLAIFPELAEGRSHAFDTARSALKGRDGAVFRARAS